MKHDNPHFISFDDFVKTHLNGSTIICSTPSGIDMTFHRITGVGKDRAVIYPDVLYFDESDGLNPFIIDSATELLQPPGQHLGRSLRFEASKLTEDKSHSAKFRSVKINNKDTSIPVPKGKSGAASARRQAKKRKGRK